MATGTNITYYFNNQTAYDLVSDGVLNPWGSTSSGKFAKAPERVNAYSAGVAFKACGDSDTETGTTGAVNYWVVSRGAELNSSKSNTKGSLQLYFSIAYNHTLYNNKWSKHNHTGFTVSWSGWSSSGQSVNVNATFAQP
jgi:hypothetical protein